MEEITYPPFVDIPVEINTDLDKKIADAFLVFDHAGNKTVEMREIGTILRSLGCCPTESEIQEIINATELHDVSGSIHLGKFLPYVAPLIAALKFQPVGAEQLLKAFKTLDKNNTGFIEREIMEKLMMECGDPFSQDEIDEMLVAACDLQTNTIPYEIYINQLLID